MNPFYTNPTGGFFAMTLLGAGVVALWLALSDPQLAGALAGSRSGADWAMLAVLLVGVLVLIGVGATVWAAGAQLIGSLVKLLAVAAIGLALWLLLATPSDPATPGPTLADRLHAWSEFWTQRRATPMAGPGAVVPGALVPGAVAPGVTSSSASATGPPPVASSTSTPSSIVSPGAPLTTSGAAPVPPQAWWQVP